MRKKEKLLVISHTPLSEHTNNGKTLTALLDFLEKDQIAQLYFNNSIPSFKICDNYYKVSDSDVIKKYIFRKKTSHRIYKQNVDKEDEFVPNTSSNFIRKISKSNFMRIIRDLWWRKYKIDIELYEWINDFAPTRVLVVMGGDIFSLKLVNEIVGEFNLENNYMFFTDDYILNKKSDKSLLNRIYSYNRKYFKQLDLLKRRIKGVFVISEKLKEAYQNEFNCDISVVMNTVIPKQVTYQRQNYDKLKIAYFGGLSIKRDISLKSLCNKLESNKIMSEIDIYTSPSNAKLIPNTDSFKYTKVINKGFIKNSTELSKKMKTYDFLLHVESHDKRMLNLTRYSISTKIPEYLNENKPIISFGPIEQASIDYLVKNNLTFYIDESTDRKDFNLLFDDEYIESLLANYSEFVNKNHSKLIQQQLIKDKIKL